MLLAPIVVAALVAPAAAHPDHLPHGCEQAVTVKQSQPFIGAVWDGRHWKRGSPAQAASKAWRHKLHCAGPGNRRAMKHRWREHKRSYFHHRQDMREMEALTPYGPWAIPEEVVMCESGGDWGAVNPESGARGPYQLLPSTYYGVCHSCDWSHLDQHRAARAVWERSGGAEWVCAG